MLALREDLDRGDLAGLLERFMRTVVHMNDAGMARFRADPVWPLRVAAAPTILREIEASNDPGAGLDVLAGVTVPVLQILGSLSAPAFARNTAALDDAPARRPDRGHRRCRACRPPHAPGAVRRDG